MTGHPIFPRRALGDMLRSLRERKGWNVTHAARVFGISRDKLNALESGSTRITSLEIDGLCEQYQPPPELKKEMKDLARAYSKDQKHWLEKLDEGIPHWARKFVGMEQRATEMLIYENEFVTGVFQTEAYLRGLMAACDWLEKAEVEKIVHSRMLRGYAYEHLDNPPQTTIVLNEHVLRRVVGGSEVMDEQMQRLIEADELPHVQIMVVPFAAGAHPSMDGAYTILGFEDDTPAVVYIESLGCCRYEDDSATVSQYRQRFSATLERCCVPIKELLPMGPWRKSSRSSQQGGQCVEWRKSSRSSDQGGQCVEARSPRTGHFQVRDSKLGDDSPILGVDRAEFGSLVAALKSGRLDG